MHSIPYKPVILSFSNSLKCNISGNLFLFFIMLVQKIFEKEGVLSITVAAGVGTYPKNNTSSIFKNSQCF